MVSGGVVPGASADSCPTGWGSPELTGHARALGLSWALLEAWAEPGHGAPGSCATQAVTTVFICSAPLSTMVSRTAFQMGSSPALSQAQTGSPLQAMELCCLVPSGCHVS